MGLLGSLVSFGVGYYAGARIGDKPVIAVRDAVGEVRQRATALANQGRTRTIGGGRAQTRREAMTAGGSMMDIREIRQVMTAAPETVELGAPIRDAAALMERTDIGNVIVVDDEQVKGIVTDRDIAVRVVAAGRDPATAMVSDIMTAFPATIGPTASVHEAIELMREHDVRRLPVVEAGRPIGVVALADLSTSPEAQALLADISLAPPNN
jgi:signal-transduction protein with cAMP-binding, CBS, and nucleotidyltransferase domain